MYEIRIDDPRQERIYQLLLQMGPGPASFYRDACVLRTQKIPLESTSHLINHLLRDANSAICTVIEAAVGMPSLFQADGKNVSGEEGKKDGYATKIRILTRELGFEPGSGVAALWLRMGSLHGLAHRDNLAAPRPVDTTAEQTWTDYDFLFDSILPRFTERFAADFYPIMEELAQHEYPTADDVKRFLGHVPQNPVTLEYFCQRATTGWLLPLRKKGFFKHPQRVERDEESGAVSYIWWPPSRYLARIAGDPNVTRDVAETILALPSTDNYRIHVDCAEAAVKLPPSIAAGLTTKVEEWLNITDRHLLPSRLGALMTHLVDGGEPTAALDVAGALLRLVPTPEPLLLGEGTKTDVHARFDPWEYHEIVSERVPRLIAIAGLAGLHALCGVLEEATQQVRIQQDGQTRPLSSLYLLDDVGKRGQFHGMRGEEKQALVGAVRDGAVSLIESGGASLQDVISSLSHYKGGIFTRLALYLVREYSQDHPDVVAPYLLDRQLFESRESGGDYRQLLHQRFALLNASQRDTVLSWIKDGPRSGRVEAIFQNWEGREPTVTEDREYIRRWQRDWLALVKEHLIGEMRSLRRSGWRIR